MSGGFLVDSLGQDDTVSSLVNEVKAAGGRKEVFQQINVRANSTATSPTNTYVKYEQNLSDTHRQDI